MERLDDSGKIISIGPLNVSAGKGTSISIAGPTVSINSPAGGATVSGKAVLVSATAAAGSGSTITSVQFQVDKNNQGSAVTVSPYSIPLDTTKLSNGIHTLGAIANDSVGNTTNSASVSITVNNNPTLVTITAPVGGTSVGGSSVPVTATVTTGSGLAITSVQFRVDDVNQGSPVTSSPYSTTLDFTKLTNGTHTITAVATDSTSANTMSTPITVTVSNVRTTVAIIAPLAGATLSGKGVPVTATVTAGTGLSITSVQFRVDDVNQGSPVTSSPYGTTLDFTKLTNGTHTITAVATDSSNATTTSTPVSVTVNNVGTTVAIIAPLAGATVSGKNVPVTATVAAGSGLTITNVQFKVDGANQGSLITTSPYGTTLDFTKLTNGTHTIIAAATDSSNTTTSSLPVSVTVNNFATTLAITTPIAGSTVSGKNVPVTATVTAGSGLTITSVQFKVDDTTQGVPLTAAPYGTVFDSTKLTNGTHNITAVATDSSNATATSTPVTITVNNFATTVVIAAPLAGATISGKNVPVTAMPTAGSGSTIVSVQFKIDDVNQGALLTANPYSIVLDSTRLTKGTHTLTAVVIDSNNNTTFTSINLTVNNTVTMVAITSPVTGTTVSGKNVAVSATATAGGALTIKSVQFNLDGFTQGTAAISPYGVTLDTTKLANGIHTLVALATDSSNSITSSAPVSVAVNNPITTVTITAPVNGATISGKNVTLSAVTTVGSGLTVAGVQFKVDNVNQGSTVTSSPYNTILDSTKLPNGNHIVIAVMMDSASNISSSAPALIKVNNSDPPMVAITSPSAGATVSGKNVAITATATAGAALTIKTVQFQVDGLAQATATVSPYSIILDTTKLANGLHTLTAIVTDSSNSTTLSSPVSITVNSVTAMVAITNPSAGAQVSGPNVMVSATATAVTGLTISKVQFKVDGSNLGAPVMGPYNAPLDTTTLTNGTHILTAVATDSSSFSVTSAPVSIVVNNGVQAAGGSPLLTSFTAGAARSGFSGFIGMQFSVGSTPLNVTALGRIDVPGNTGSHLVKLLNARDGSDVPGGSATVSLASGVPGQFVYAQLPAPVTLQPNTTYYLVSLEAATGDTWYDYGPVAATNLVTVNGPVFYLTGFGFDLFGVRSNSYIPLNLQYSTSSIGTN